MLRAIVFDFDGVIVDSEPLHHAAFMRVAEPLGVSFGYDEYLARYVGYDDRDAFRVMFGRPPGGDGGLPDGLRLEELCQEKGDAFEDVIAEGVRPIDGVLPLIEEVSESGLPVAIASGATRRDIDLIVARLGIADRFGAVVTADDVRRSKPDPQTYALAVQRLAEQAGDDEVRPERCLAIEDTPAGVASARAAGLMTLGLATTGPASTLHDAQRVIENLSGVTIDQLRQWYG